MVHILRMKHLKLKKKTFVYLCKSCQLVCYDFNLRWLDRCPHILFGGAPDITIGFFFGAIWFFPGKNYLFSCLRDICLVVNIFIVYFKAVAFLILKWMLSTSHYEVWFAMSLYSFPRSKKSYIQQMLNFIKHSFFASTEMIMWFLSFDQWLWQIGLIL